MSVAVKFDELLAACDWVSAGEAAGMECEAYVNRATGIIYWCGDGCDEDTPENVEDGSLYIAVPHTNEFDLGRALAIRYVEEQLPRSREAVIDFFRKRGAFAKFKSLLERHGKLDAWYEYETNFIENALRVWCEENAFELVR